MNECLFVCGFQYLLDYIRMNEWIDRGCRGVSGLLSLSRTDANRV